eukprot:snap_masked-scaffold_8-processed-gene-10.51-mRNA-1 protein AED:1.00 eAED:1.00 QI:0/-1/0/0/-1/1/1/0/208
MKGNTKNKRSGQSTNEIVNKTVQVILQRCFQELDKRAEFVQEVMERRTKVFDEIVKLQMFLRLHFLVKKLSNTHDSLLTREKELRPQEAKDDSWIGPIPRCRGNLQDAEKPLIRRNNPFYETKSTEKKKKKKKRLISKRTEKVVDSTQKKKEQTGNQSNKAKGKKEDVIQKYIKKIEVHREPLGAQCDPEIVEWFSKPENRPPLINFF